MLWYISSSKKRGDYIKTYINWCLKEDNNVIIDNKNKECNYEANKYLEYIENDFKNTIDLDNNLYIRENNEYKFVIDFNKLIQTISLKDKKIDFSSEIEGNINIENNIIYLKYNNSDSYKEIIIQIL